MYESNTESLLELAVDQNDAARTLSFMWMVLRWLPLMANEDEPGGVNTKKVLSAARTCDVSFFSEAAIDNMTERGALLPENAGSRNYALS